MKNTRVLQITLRLMAFVALAVASFAASTGHINADPSFGVDVPSGPPAADILEPAPGAPIFGPVGAPATTIAPAALGLPPGANMDDFSYGDDVFPPAAPWHVVFSVSGASTGHPAAGPPISPVHPNVTLEGPILAGGDGAVGGDIYSSFAIAGGVGPTGGYAFAAPPPAACGVHDNIQVADEDGLVAVAPYAGPNVGLGLAPADNIDALDLLDDSFVDFVPAGGDGAPDAPIFFTVDGPTAAALGALPPGGAVTPGSVLVWDPGAAALFNWAPAGALGLLAGDDIDGLAVGYVSGAPLPAGFAGGGDTILFSLKPGSPSLAAGLPTFCFGALAGTAGDIFGVGIFPGIVPVVDAEMMGLAEIRSGGGGADDVDAIDIVVEGAVDTDGDLLNDAVDLDDDDDGLGDMAEGPSGCSPIMADTDADGLSDYTEVVVQGTSCFTVDTDSDGCADSEEIGANEMLGGDRSPTTFWDYFDVWTHPGGNPALWQRNKVVDLFNDIFGVANRFGAQGVVPATDAARVAAALTVPVDDTSYHIDYDRSPPAPGADPWDMGPPNGTIDLFTDIFGVANQFGHNCQAAP